MTSAIDYGERTRKAIDEIMARKDGAMTDNRTTELTATERICEQLEAAGVSFVRSEQIIEGTYWGVTWFIGETKFEFRENDKRTDLIAFNSTPEQAIAATLGSEREKALEELVQDWQALYEYPDYGDCICLRKRMQELGIEVIDE